MVNLKDFAWLRSQGAVSLFKQFYFKYYSDYIDSKHFDYSSFEFRRHKIDKDFYNFIDLIMFSVNIHTNIFEQKLLALKDIESTIINYYKRQKRLVDRINYILINYDNACFITLTFNNNYINCKSHRKFVTDFLKSQSQCYVANIDYGAKNGRMHYHAVASGRINPKLWLYGNCDVKAVTYGNPDMLSSYINKLTNHATKNTTKNSKCIYSRLEKKH